MPPRATSASRPVCRSSHSKSPGACDSRAFVRTYMVQAYPSRYRQQPSQERHPHRGHGPQELALRRRPQGCGRQRHALFPDGNRQGQRDRAPGLPEIPLRTLPEAKSTECMRALMPQHVDKFLLASRSKPKPRKKKRRRPLSHIRHIRERCGCLRGYISIAAMKDGDG